MRLHHCGFVLIALMHASVSSAEQAPSLVSLRWSAPPDSTCPTGADLSAMVETHLRREVFDEGREPDFRLAGELHHVPEEGGWVAELELTRRDGSEIGVRRLTTDSERCDDLAGSLALTIALMIDIERTIYVPPEPEEEEPVSRADDRGHWRGGLELGLRMDYVMLPGVTWGPHLSADLDPPRFIPIHLSVVFVTPSTTTDEQGRGSVLWAWHVAFGVRPRVLRSSHIDLAVVGGVEAGMVRARGVGFDENTEEISVLTQLTAGLRMIVRPSRWLEINLDVLAGVPMIRQRFVHTAADGTEQELFNGPPVFFSTALSFGVRIE